MSAKESSRGAGADREIVRWDLPPVMGPAINVRGAGPSTVENLQRIEAAARDEGYAKGYEAGMKVARSEMQAQLDTLASQVKRFDAALNFLTQPLSQLSDEVQQQLVKLSMTVARHVVRRELKLDPGQVVAVIRETVALLPVAARDVKVHLHPEDAALVRERLGMPSAERAWSIIEDPVLTRGGCKVTTDTAHVDARVEARLGAAISATLGDERAPGRE
jgi:flagellar assembly protein FliH